MKTLLHHLRPAASRHPSAMPLGAEKRLQLAAGHYTRDRVAAFLYHARYHPVPDRAPSDRGA